MRALYRVVQLSEAAINQYATTLAGILNKLISDTARDENDQSPNYIYILFETTALTIKHLKNCS
jgi:hypothetical protein